MGSLSNQFISQSFISLIHLGNDNIITSSFTTLQDGLGNSLNVSVNAQGDISASGNIYAANLTGSAGSINTGSFVTTSSFNSYTSSTNARLNSIETSTASFSNSITSLNASSASQQLEINALEGFTSSVAGTNTFTASAANSISALNASSASQQLEINALEATSGSLITSASNAVYTASFDNGTRNLTFTKGNTTQFSVNIPDASGSILPSGTISSSAQISELGFVSSSVTASSLTTASISGQTITFTKGNASTFDIILPSGSVPTDITALNNFTASVFGTNAFTQSADQRLDSIEAQSGSWVTAAITGSSVQSITAGLATLSLDYVKGDGTSQNITLVAPAGTDITALNNATASLQAFTASVAGTNTFTASIAGTNTFTASAQNSLNSLNAATSSYARLNVNNQFTTDQTITGSLVVTGTITANELHVIIESSSVIYSSGSNQFGDELSDTQILSGSTKLVGTATLNGNALVTSAETASYIQDLTALNNFTASVAGTNTFTQSAQLEINSLEAFSASALITASATLNTLTFTKGNGSTFAVTVNTGSAGAAFPFTGSAGITGSLSVIGGITSRATSLSTGNDVSITPNDGSGTGIKIADRNSFTTGISISGSVISSGQDQIKINNVNRGRIVLASALGDSDRTVFAVTNNGTGRAAINGYIGASVGFTYNNSDDALANAIYISASNNAEGHRNFIGFNARPNEYAGTIWNYVFAPLPFEQRALGGMRMAAFGHMYVSQSFTASIQSGYAWVGGPNNTTIAVATSSFAGTPVDISALNAFSASTNLFTQSAQLEINALEGFTASVAGTNAFTQSADQRLDSIEAQSGSWVTSAITASSLVTASFSGNTLTFTKGDASTFGVVLPDVSGSAGTTIFETVYTGESITKGDPLYISGSQGANPIVFKADAAVPTKMPVTFVASETIGAANTTQGIVLGLIEGIDLTGYVAGQEIYVAEGGGWSASKPSGSNSITQLLGVVTKGGAGGKGLVLNPGPATLPGLDNGNMWVGGATNQPIEISTSSFASSASFNSYTSSTNLFTASAQLEINALEAFTASIAGTNAFTASQLLLNSTYATTGSNIFVGDQTITGSLAINDSATNFLIEGNGFSQTYLTSNGAIVLNPGFGGVEMVGSYRTFKATDITAEGTLSASVITGIGNVTLYSQSVDSRINAIVPTNISALNAFTASVAGTNLFTQSAQLEINALEAFSASALTTASFSGNTLTFTKGNGTTFGVTIPDVSGSTINTGSFATTGSNAFFGNQTISGSVGISGSAITFVSGTLSGSTITNIGDTFTDVAPVNRIITLTSASYAALVTGSLTDPNALYIVSGSTSGSITGPVLVGNNNFVGNQTITGSLILSSSAVTELQVIGDAQITGSLFLSSSAAIELNVVGNSVFSGSVIGRVIPVTIASNTASLDFSQGNFFTVALAATVGTHISASNVQPGETVSVRITQNATPGTLTYSSAMKFPSGSAYTASTTAGAVDIVTFISYDNSTVFASSVKNMI
jgi:hypothetical protein